MAYDFEESSVQYITFPANVSYSNYVSISAWVYFEALSGSHQQNIIDKGSSSTWYERNFSLNWTPNYSGAIGMSWGTADPLGEWACTEAIATGVWQHWYAEVDWTTNPDTVNFWLNGTSKTLSNVFGSNNTAPNTDSGHILSVGREHSGFNEHDGMIAEIGVWNDLGGAARMTQLSKGYSPLFFPNNLTEYIPLVRDLRNYKGGTGTNNGATVASHPRVIYPSRQQIAPFAATLPPAAQSALLTMMGVG